jgi:hypothetical protein
MKNVSNKPNLNQNSNQNLNPQTQTTMNNVLNNQNQNLNPQTQNSMKKTTNHAFGNLNPFATDASEMAARANEQALAAREQRTLRDKTKHVLDNWKKIMMNAPVIPFTVIYLLAFWGEALVSWEMYRDVLAAIFPDTQPFWATLIMALFIGGFAAVVSHYGSKRFQQNLFELDVFNTIFITHLGDYTERKAREDVAEDMKKDTRWFWIGFVMLLLVGFISFNRTILMQAAEGEEQGGVVVNLFSQILPIVIVIIEVFTGFYLVYLIKLMTWTRDHKKYAAAFTQHLNATISNDRAATELAHVATHRNETILDSRHLKDALYRYEHLNTNDDYINEVEHKEDVETPKITAHSEVNE